MSAPLIAAVSGLAMAIYELSRQLSKTTAGVEVQEKYKPLMYQIQVDLPLNTE